MAYALSATLPRSLYALFGALTPSLATRLLHARALHRQRLALASLDDRLLADIGLTRAQAQAEADAPFWDAPAHWQR